MLYDIVKSTIEKIMHLLMIRFKALKVNQIAESLFVNLHYHKGSLTKL